jgi:hypothetical protein
LIVGLDFDNTILRYDALFVKLARELYGYARPDASKTEVRDWLRREHGEQHWIRIQGLAYGTHIEEAELFPGVEEFFTEARAEGWQLHIVSHKTPFAASEAREDLHAAARRWLAQSPLRADGFYLEPTRERKLERIAALGCQLFLDDLPEFLREPGFPAGTRAVLFDPAGHWPDWPGERITSWAQLRCLTTSPLA